MADVTIDDFYTDFDDSLNDSNEEKDTPDDSVQDEENFLFVVAVDFGTTYSGYAFSSREQFSRDPLDIQSNQQLVPGGSNLLSLKTSTSLLIKTDGSFVAFGFHAEDKFYAESAENQSENLMLFRRFKMKLHNKKVINDQMMLEDVTGKKYPAKEIFTLSIKALTVHFKKNFTQKMGIKLSKKDLRWVLTVPAIWGDAAKKFMRQCAIGAGIPTKMLKIALEPEAASIYCQFLPIEKNPEGFGMTKEGTRYMVVDIGGGTVDITVHEKVENRRLREIHKATGGACGGTAVDKEFEKHLTDILGEKVMEKLRKEKPEYYLDIFRDFEVVKRSLASERTYPIRMSIPAVTLNELCEKNVGKTLEEVFERSVGSKVERDKININVETMKSFFDPSIHEIIEHMQKVVDNPKTKGISIILLVGGSAESIYIQTEIKKSFNSVRFVMPPEAGLSVVKGAVIFGHDPSLIKSRILRFTYGMSICPEFDPEIHPEAKKITVGGVDRCRDCFDVIISAGTEVEIGHRTCRVCTPTSPFQLLAAVKIFCTSEKEVKYTDDEGCFLLGELPVPLPMNLLMGLFGQNEQPFIVCCIFGDTELQVIAIDVFSSTPISCTLEMREEEDEGDNENQE
ncbi:heat shock 70 kDa protein 12A-like [Saccostrea cucullata]|uniref:heat shock 70 kDa protein 12A-like n=1 Tax=Saccostrea cuccullata TaxID=36930 RepID=UPI002ED1D55E